MEPHKIIEFTCIDNNCSPKDLRGNYTAMNRDRIHRCKRMLVGNLIHWGYGVNDIASMLGWNTNTVRRWREDHLVVTAQSAMNYKIDEEIKDPRIAESANLLKQGWSRSAAGHEVGYGRCTRTAKDVIDRLVNRHGGLQSFIDKHATI